MINQNQETNSLSASDIKPESVPALDLSFEWVKDVLSKQCADVDAIDNKAITLFSVATAIVGLGLGIPIGTSTLPLKYFISSPLGWISVFSYAVVAILTVYSLWVRTFETLDNPVTIREWYWQLTPFQFKINILTYLEDSFEQNQSKLKRKGLAVRLMIPAIAIETVFLLLLFVFSL